MRVLLATEGPSDDIVGTALLKHFCPGIEVDRKRFVARGFPVVVKAVPTLVNAAHYGYYDLLAIQFDLDDTFDITKSADISTSARWRKITGLVTSAIPGLRHIFRVHGVQCALMAGCQSTDGWLCWGNDGGNPLKYEKMHRRAAKESLYGKPPRDVLEKAEGFVQNLIARMKTEGKWPVSLRFFADQFSAAVSRIPKED